MQNEKNIHAEISECFSDAYKKADNRIKRYEHKWKRENEKNKRSTERLKHYLRGAWYWKNKKDLLLDKIEVLRSRAEKITTSYQDVPTFGGFADHRQALIDEMVDMQAKYAEAVKTCEEKEKEIQFFIESLDGYPQDYQERIILEYRYIYSENWQDIALRLNYSERMIYKLHGRALLHLLEIHRKIVENGGKALF